MPHAVAPGFHLGDPLALGILFLGVALVAAIAALSHTRSHAFSPALVYLGLGLVAALLIELLDFAWNDPVSSPGLLEHLGLFALIIALFGAGLRFGSRPPWQELRAVIALLAFSMPVAIALVALFGVHVMGLSAGAAIVLGAVLAPTDPVLAGDIGVRPPGEEEAETRPGHVIVSGEAGLNDALATPFVVLGLLVATHDGPGWLPGWIGVDIVYSVLVGAAVGAVAGYGLGALVVRLHGGDLLATELETFIALAAALLVYGLAQSIGALGLLAAFVAGAAFRRYEADHAYNRNVHRGADRIESFLELAVILVLGSVATLGALSLPGLTGWLLAPLILLVVRPLAALPALAGARLGWRGRAFVAWFGVRGVASIYFGAAVIASGDLAGEEAARVFWTGAVVVMVSIVAHGISATPLGGLADERTPGRPRGG